MRRLCVVNKIVFVEESETNAGFTVTDLDGEVSHCTLADFRAHYTEVPGGPEAPIFRALERMIGAQEDAAS